MRRQAAQPPVASVDRAGDGMRILQYHPRALIGDGGITNSVRRLSDSMAAAGAKPAIVYARSSRQPPPGPVDWIPVRHRRLGPLQIPVDLARALHGADILVLNSAWTAHNVRAGAAARRQGVPYVLADRGAYDPSILRRRRRLKQLWWTALERELVLRARALHVFFRSQQASLRQLGYQGPVIVAPNGVQVPDGHRWDGGSGGYLLYVGRFDPEHKGLDLLVRALAALPADRRPQLHMHGPDWRGGKQRLVALVEDLRLQPWVSIGPAVHGEDKWRLMTAARGFVYPSRWEGFGNAPAEAAGLGVPVLTTPYPLGRHLEDHGAAIVTEADPGALAEGLETLARGMPDVGRRAAALIQETFTWEAVAATWLDQIAVLKTEP